MSSDDPKQDEKIARIVLGNCREKIIKEVNVWFVAPFTLNAELVGDNFIKQLHTSAEEGLSSQQLMSRLLDRVVLRSGWLPRFINVLSEYHRYRPLAVELNDQFNLLSEREGNPYLTSLLELLQRTIKILRESQANLEQALKCRGLPSVQHCVNLLGAAVGYLQTEAKEVEGRCPPKKPDKNESVESQPCPIVAPEEPLMPVSAEEGEPKKSTHELGTKIKKENETKNADTKSTEKADETLWGFSEMQVIHQVLRRNRGYLEMKIPIKVILADLHGQDVLVDYEYEEVKSQPFEIKMNRCFLDALMRKSPEMYNRFCSILAAKKGYEYIVHYLEREIRALDPTIPVDQKKKPIPQAVNALVDREMLNKSIASIIDNQREMANEVRKVHQTEVSQLKKAVSDAKNSVYDVKGECGRFLKEVEEKSGSSEQLVTLQGRIKELIHVCEDVQLKQKDEQDTLKTVITAVELRQRIGELTLLLEQKEREIATWKGTAETRDISLTKSKAKYKEMKDTKERETVALRDELTASKGRCEAVESELTQRSNSLTKSEAKYKEMKDTKEKEIVDLRDDLAQIQRILTKSEEMKDTKERENAFLRDELAKIHSSLAKSEDMKDAKERENAFLRDELAKIHSSLTESKAKYKEMKDTKEREIVVLRNELTACKGKCEAVESELAKIHRRLAALKSEHEELKVTKETIESELVSVKKSLTKSKVIYKEMKDTKEREIVALRDELTASKGRCEVVESELAQIKKRMTECERENIDLKRVHSGDKKSSWSLFNVFKKQPSQVHGQPVVMEETVVETLPKFEEYEEVLPVVEITSPDPNKPLNLIAKEAEHKLESDGCNGAFIVRTSSPSSSELVLSVWNEGKCTHFDIHQKKSEGSSTYSVDNEKYFNDMRGLCDYYERANLPGCDFGLRYCLN